MKNLQAYKKQIQEIEGLISKLEEGELSLDELLTLEKLTRELHEKSIILKYKAFETHVNGETAPPVEEEPIVEFQPVEEVSPEEPDEEEETPNIDFSIFESMNGAVEGSEETFEPEPEIEKEPEVAIQPVDVTPEPDEEEEIAEPEMVEEEPKPVEEPKAEVNLSFWKK